MKKTMLLLLSTGMIVIAANAQNVTSTQVPQTQNQPNKHEGIIKTLKDMGITDDQLLKSKAVMDDSKAKLEALKKDQSLSIDAKKAKMKEILDDQQTKLKGIVGEEKYNKAKEAVGAAKAKNGGLSPTPSNNRNEMMMKKMKELGIADDQILKCKAVMDNAKTQLDQVKNDASLPVESKKSKAKEILDAQQAKLKEVLGEEKFKQVKAAWSDMNKKEAPKN